MRPHRLNMPASSDTFRQVCEQRQLSAVAPADLNVSTLGRLVLENEDYAVPVLAAFKHFALPIAAEWILSDADATHKATILCRLALLCPLWPPLQPLTEHFLAMNVAREYVSESLFSAENIQDVLTAIMRLILHDYGRFSRYFSAETLRRLAAESSAPTTRMLALQTLGLLTQVSEAVVDTWVARYIEGDSSKFEFNDVLLEARRKAVDIDLVQSTELALAPVDFENALIANVENVFVPRFGQGASDSVPFVRTATAVENLRRTAVTLLKDKAMLLTGEPGAGKTFFAEALHSKVRPSSEIVRIHLGDQTDAKALVGTYTTGSTPGTFEWSPGALMTAVLAGKWVLIEDIDRAPTDIVAVLLPLIDRRELVVPSRNQIVKASPGFQLVATTTDSHTDVIGSRGWEHCEIMPPTDDDLIDIIRSRCPFLTTNVVHMVLDTFRRVQEFQESHSFVRRATTRDLFKLVGRLTARYDGDDLFRETVACFSSYLADPTPLVSIVADAMGVPTSKVIPLLSRHKPAVSLSTNELVIGRAAIERRPVSGSAARNAELQIQGSKFTLTGPTLRLLEEVAVSVSHGEPVLLVGETGTGKTSVVQYLAQLARRKLVVINVSQQVEAGDLIGGFKPVDARQLASSVLEQFNELFDSTFSRAKNHQFIQVLERTVTKQQWGHVVKLLKEAIKMASPQRQGGEAKRPRVSGDWAQFAAEVDLFDRRVQEVQHQAQFQFIEGLLVRAMRQGHWVLLDELNLAPADTLEGIGELVSSRSLTLLERGGEVVKASGAFRLFANMNPATDVGKRDLPPGVRAQFTELWAPSPDSDPDALRSIVSNYLPQGTQLSIVNDVCDLYTDAKELSGSHQLTDGAGQRPHFSIRTLSRALVSAAAISSRFGLRRALYEAFSMCFLTLLDEKSALILNNAIDTRLLAKLPNRNSVLAQTPQEPSDGKHYTQFKHWWMSTGSGVPQDDPGYIVTPFVERNLLNLVRATVTKLFPVLIQGPTSSGKTSMISHLAKKTGHTVVRINNHEHTDLAEYLGGYESDNEGKLVFREGALVTALRQGHWLVLDELNLAPTDVLEALNRLLDDNRELLIPETQEIIKPHPDFILFATQNPPGIYAGRKILSRAFRNRFLELHFGDIPETELEVILRDRSHIAPSYAAKIVEVYRELSRRRSGSRVFEHAATLRDLFRWANRPAVGYEELAQNGFALLGERARSPDERELVRSVISDVMRVPADVQYEHLAPEAIMNAAPSNIVWTAAMRRVLTLVHLALMQNEPVLLVGETGCGKTTIVQAIAAAQQRRLTILNAHQNTETGDLVGSQRPARHSSSAKLFEWVDGPLVSALKNGEFFLLDEISLADDSVLERLNSVLEADRTLFVPEVGSFQAEHGFQFLATMNPGGDYGKKELSPALRNRFTEIWVPSVDNEDDLKMIVRSGLQSGESETQDKATDVIVAFSQYFSENFGLVSLRDVLSWTHFVNRLGLSKRSLVQGASMVFIDGLGSNAYAHLSSQPGTLARAKSQCFSELERLVGEVVVAADNDLTISETEISIGGFSIPRLADNQTADFSFNAPTTALNAMRVMRALQSKRPVLLEGSPGAGKTSLIAALAKASGHKLTRINLSDQTDLADLFGSDIPLDKPGKFGWRDAPFLRAMQKGEWVLLDEMNLAAQQVLEGLNACLDHRGEAYVPELDQTFAKHPDFVVFAAQNPHAQGGGRKGLPKSFVNRFAVVYVEQLGLDDLHAIAASSYPAIDASIRERLATFVEELARWASTHHIPGGPFEFNLRDTMRWMDLVAQTGEHPSRFLGLVITQRFRTLEHRHEVEKMFLKYFKDGAEKKLNPVSITPASVSFGAAEVGRSGMTFSQAHFGVLSRQIDVLETATYCIKQRWPVILVGNSGSGKTSVIRLLSQLFGARLHEFAMTADVDSTDLLGEFDQVEEQGQLERIWSDFDELIDVSDINSAALVDSVRSRDLKSAVSLLPEGHELIDLVREFQARDFTRPTFQWVDGMLVRAVEQGHWLVLDNANLCSPAVLDRLNSLLEREGTLSVNECAQSDGSPREVTPHPNFRLFMTVDPRYGELSRAMRNRGTEVWMTSDYSSHDQLVIEKRTAAGALTISRFSKPFNAAKLADLNNRSWLRALLLDPQTAEHISQVDTELGEFIAAIGIAAYWKETLSVTVETLRRLWSVFNAKRILSAAEATNSPTNLLQLSALRRRKDSVECDFDLYGLVEKSCELLSREPLNELASVLTDFLKVEDPSRVPVFRDWFIDYGKKHGIPQFVEAVVEMLGSAYDFSDGGAGMTRIWQAYSREQGFSSREMHDSFVRGQHMAAEFDRLVRSLDWKYAEAISGIRFEFVQAVGSRADVLLELETAFNTFKESLPSQASTHPPQKLLALQFQGLFNAFALAYTNHRAPKLLNALTRIGSYADISTRELLDLNSERKLNAPAINDLPKLESIILDALRVDIQGAAREELAELSRTMLEQSSVIVEVASPTDLIKNLVVRNAHLISSTVQEASATMEEITELAAVDAVEACAKLASHLLMLYVCPLPLDPAIAQHIWYERYKRLQLEYAEDNTAWHEIREVFGSGESKVDSWLQSRELEQVPLPNVYRPQKSAAAQVHRDMVAAAQLARSIKLKALTSEERDLIKRNAAHLQERLRRATGYRDLVGPVQTGLALLTLSLSVPKHSGSEGSLWLLNPATLGHSVQGDVQEYPLLVLRSLACTEKLLLEPLKEVLDDLYRRWTLERLRVEEERREEASGFRYEDDDGLAAEREFIAMFPDYEKETDLPRRNDDFAPRLVSIYKSLFDGTETNAVDVSMAAAAEIGSDGRPSRDHIPVLYLAMKTHLTSDTKQSADINFYLDSSAQESTVGVQFASKVGHRAKELLEIWPEHDSLQTLSRVSQEIQSLPPAVPVALHLAKAEQLHHWLYEWDRFASKEARVSDLISQGSNIIVRWRRLELATWPALFAIERRKCVEENARFWYNLYETLIVTPPTDLAEAAKILTIFMAEATLGQCEDRLELLKCFQKHTKLIGLTDIAQCIGNVVEFHQQFLPAVQQLVQSSERQLRKQVDDIVRLASWRDVNVHALKQSAQRSHRHLFKVVKKYRTLLAQKAPIESNYQVSAPTASFVASDWPKRWQAKWLSPLRTANGLVRPWNERPKTLREVETTAKVLQSYVTRAASVSTASLAELADNVENQAKELRAETPKAASKDTKKTIANLRVQKQQVLTATLRELRRAGLRTSVRKDVAASQLELVRVLAETPYLQESSNSFQTSESSFFALIELLPRLRATIGEAANNAQIDVPFSDLQRGLAFAENIFAYILRLRRAAGKHMVAGSISDLSESLSILAETKAAAIWDGTSAKDITRTAHELVNVTVSVLERLYKEVGTDEPIEVVNLRAANSEVPNSTLGVRTSATTQWIECISEAAGLLSDHCSHPSSDHGAGQLVYPLAENLKNVISELKCSITPVDTPNSVLDVDDAVSEASLSVLVAVQYIVKELDTTESVSRSDEDGQDGEEQDSDEDADDWLTTSLERVERLLVNLRAAQVIPKIVKAEDLIIRLSASNADLAGAFATLLAAFARGYQDLVRAIETVFARTLARTVSGALKLSAMLLSLATEGFCSPESSDGDDDTEEGAEGTGLGDGTGAQSSSKDVDEEDDDVSEAMQTANPDQQDRDEADDGEDNAREVEGEMAGKTEDLPPQSDDEDDDQGNEEDEEEPDDEVGDLDDLDPNAIDEKMWDDEKDGPEDKEKHTDDTVQGSKDEEAEAQENDAENREEQASNANDNLEQDEGSDAEEVEQQDEEIKQGDQDELQDATEQKDALDLPEDMDLDEQDIGGDEEDADVDDAEEDLEFQGPMSDTEEVGQPEEQQNPSADDSISDNEDAQDSAVDEKPNPAESDSEMVDQQGDSEEENNGEEDSRNDLEDMEVDENDQQQALPEGEGEGVDVEGLDGQDDQSSEQQEQSAATDNRSSNRGKGASEDAENAEENLGAGGSSGAQDEAEMPEDSSAKNDSTSESLKTLGDAMKEFHRRHRPIRERGEKAEEELDAANDSDQPLQGNEELEHVGADDAHDTQALGRSNDQERQSVDEKLAIDDEEDPESQDNVAGDEDEGAEAGAQAGGDAADFNEDDSTDSADDKPSLVSAGAQSLLDVDDEENSIDLGKQLVQESLKADHSPVDLWQIYEAKTHDLALVLGEQLRLILEPTVASKLRGDFRTGKRLNMKRIIPYIASDFRKDKIWLRRTKPAKRQYQVLLAVDDSRSMGEPEVVDLAFQAVALVGSALSNIEAGQMGVAKFGDSTEFVHDLDKPLTAQAGNTILKQFDFAQQRTNVRELLERSIDMFAEHQSGGEQWRLEIIISDGITDDHAQLRRLVRKARDERIMLVFIVLDALNKDTSILDMNEVRYVTDEGGNQKLEVSKYMEDFPFDYYVIVRNIVDLPMILASVLRQYFQAVDDH